jgi:hypothetical protein
VCGVTAKKYFSALLYSSLVFVQSANREPDDLER